MNVAKTVYDTVMNGTINGTSGMAQLPKSLKRLKKDGVKVKVDQQLRSIVWDSPKGRRFLVFILDAEDGTVWALWECLPKQSNFGSAVFTRYEWQGWVTETQVREAA